MLNVYLCIQIEKEAQKHILLDLLISLEFYGQKKAKCPCRVLDAPFTPNINSVQYLDVLHILCSISVQTELISLTSQTGVGGATVQMFLA